MTLYLKRAFGYILRMIILLGILFAIMYLTGTLQGTEGGPSVYKELFISTRGAILLAVLFLLAFVYPKLSFTSVDVRADMSADKQAIIDAFASIGYSIGRQERGMMVFRANSGVKRFLSMYDDAITVTGSEKYINIEGPKRDVPRVESRILATRSGRE